MARASVQFLLAHQFPAGNPYNALTGPQKRAVDRAIVTELLTQVPFALTNRWRKVEIENVADENFLATAEIQPVLNAQLAELNSGNESYATADPGQWEIRYYFIPPNEDRPSIVAPVMKTVSTTTEPWTITQSISGTTFRANVVVAVTSTFMIPLGYLEADRRMEVLAYRLDRIQETMRANPDNPHA